MRTEPPKVISDPKLDPGPEYINQQQQNPYNNNDEGEGPKKEIESNTDGSQNEKYIPVRDSVERPRLEDVYGSDELISELEELVLNITHEDLFQDMQTSAYKTTLFYGPPGNGKTLAAKAVRNEVANQGEDVMWLPYDIGRYGTAYINMGAKNLQKFFDAAYKASEEGNKVIIFIDEVDSLLGARGSGNHKEDDKIVDTYNKNQQYINDEISGVFTLLATNYADAIDSAAVRSGRVDKTVYFPQPDKPTRYRFIKEKASEYNNKMQQGFSADLFNKMNCDKLADEADGLNMSDINTAYDNAIRSKVYGLLKDKSDLNTNYKVGENDLRKEIQRLKSDKGYDRQGIGF